MQGCQRCFMFLAIVSLPFQRCFSAAFLACTQSATSTTNAHRDCLTRMMFACLRKPRLWPSIPALSHLCDAKRCMCMSVLMLEFVQTGDFACNILHACHITYNAWHPSEQVQSKSMYTTKVTIPPALFNTLGSVSTGLRFTPASSKCFSVIKANLLIDKEPRQT